jgi:uncharacterized metal-binding protein YceD (DUF177 family)
MARDRIGRLSRIVAERRFRLAASERQAEIEDRDAESVDVIAAVPRLDLAELVEDEALLSLPMAPAHERCPGSLEAPPGVSVDVSEGRDGQG